jgi:ATP-dependent Clp protease adaptor protein ClpS
MGLRKSKKMKKEKLNSREENQFEDYLSSRHRYKLIVHNDDVNTFRHVIVTLMHICQHDEVQAEQCATLVHHKGKCVVKTGGEAELELMKERLAANNLTVSLEKGGNNE